MSRSPKKNSTTVQGPSHDDNSGGALRTREESPVEQKFCRASGVKISFSKKHGNVIIGGTKETPSPSSGTRFINIWKELSNGFVIAISGITKFIFSGRFIHGLFSYWSELLVTLLVKFLLCSFGMLTGLERDIQRCSYFTWNLCPTYFDRDLSPNLFLIDRSAYQSNVLDSYFYPEMTENGTLLSLGVIRMTCVGNIPIFYDLFELLGSD